MFHPKDKLFIENLYSNMNSNTTDIYKNINDILENNNLSNLIKLFILTINNIDNQTSMNLFKHIISKFTYSTINQV